jgi:YidC/Oxa1 family membrane protein insertase
LLDDNRDKSMQRNQLIGIVVLTLMVVGWSYFLMPTPTPPPPAPSPTAAAPESTPIEPEAPAPVESPTPPPAGSDADSSPGSTLPVALPPVPEGDNQEADEAAFRNEHLELVFTRIGGRLKRATVLLGKEGRDSVQVVPIWRNTPDTEAVYPLGLRFGDERLGDELDRRRWEVQRDDVAGTITFTLEVAGFVRVEKKFQTGSAPYLLQMTCSYTNLESAPRRYGSESLEPAYSVNWGPNVNSEDVAKGVSQEIIWQKGGQNVRHTTAKLEPPARAGGFSERDFDVDWLAIRSAYFVIGMKPEFAGAQGWVAGGPKHFRAGVGVSRMEVAAGATDTRSFLLYLGPNKGDLLAGAWPGLVNVWEFFTSVKIMDRFAKALLSVLNFFHDHMIANYGLAIIFLTVLVRLAMLPLTLKGMKNMKKMQKLAPEMEKIKAELGDNQQELQKRMMELYRERGVSPLGGCFPLLLQMPVFIALYRMLWSAVELRRAPFFLWMQDMSQPDQLMRLPFEIPIPFSAAPLDSLNVLPILMGVSMLVSQKLMPASGPVQNQQQKIMMNIMPIFFAVICYNVASGLNLYILVSTLLGIAQNYAIPSGDVDVTPRKKILSRSKHFYTAAQARKRQMAKEVRREKKAKQRRPDPKTGEPGKK